MTTTTTAKKTSKKGARTKTAKRAPAHNSERLRKAVIATIEARLEDGPAAAAGKRAKRPAGQPSAGVSDAADVAASAPVGSTPPDAAPAPQDAPRGNVAAKRANTAKPAKAPKPDKPSKPVKDAPAPKPKRTSALDAAATVLAGAKEPMSAKVMVDLMAERGLWSSKTGKTPAATLYAAIIREISAKGREARFTKTDRGLFATKGA